MHKHKHTYVSIFRLSNVRIFPLLLANESRKTLERGNKKCISRSIVANLWVMYYLSWPITEFNLQSSSRPKNGRGNFSKYTSKLFARKVIEWVKVDGYCSKIWKERLCILTQKNLLFPIVQKVKWNYAMITPHYTILHNFSTTAHAQSNTRN